MSQDIIQRVERFVAGEFQHRKGLTGITQSLYQLESALNEIWEDNKKPRFRVGVL